MRDSGGCQRLVAWHAESPQPHYPRSGFIYHQHPQPPAPRTPPTQTNTSQGSQTERLRAALHRNTSIIQLSAPQPPPTLILHLSIIKNEHLTVSHTHTHTHTHTQKTPKTKGKASWFHRMSSLCASPPGLGPNSRTVFPQICKELDPQPPSLSLPALSFCLLLLFLFLFLPLSLILSSRQNFFLISRLKTAERENSEFLDVWLQEVKNKRRRDFVLGSDEIFLMFLCSRCVCVRVCVAIWLSRTHAELLHSPAKSLLKTAEYSEYN